jgi:hypothetical protein
MIVGELRNLLAGVPDHLEIVVRAWDDDGSDYFGTVGGAEVQYAHDEDDTPFFAIDCGEEESRSGSCDDGPLVDTIRPGALVELAIRDEPRPAVMLARSPRIGDRGRVVRIVHWHVEGEPLEGGEQTIAHVLLENQDRTIGFPLSCLRPLPERGPVSVPDSPTSDPHFDSDPDDGGD